MIDSEKEFIRHITTWQNDLYSYLFTLLGDLHDSRDVLQETNLVLWRKKADFEPGSNFGAWAKRCAYYEALKFRRTRQRDRHLFGDDLIALLVDEHEPSGHDEEERRLALRDCLAQLPEQQRQIIDRRYRAEVSVRQLAEEFGKKESAIKMMMKRIREALQVCIESKLREATR